MKELTYMHSEGIMAGELKHGPLALVDDSMPVIMIVMRDPVYVVGFYPHTRYFFFLSLGRQQKQGHSKKKKRNVGV